MLGIVALIAFAVAMRGDIPATLFAWVLFMLFIKPSDWNLG